jgi:hypothetical protein
VTLYWDKPPQGLGTTQSDRLGSLYATMAIRTTVPLSATSGWHLVYAVGQTTRAVGVGFFQVR